MSNKSEEANESKSGKKKRKFSFLKISGISLCVFVIFILSGGLGPVLQWVVPPVARLYKVPLKIDAVRIYPLVGSFAIRGLLIDNPSPFREDEGHSDYPILKLDSFYIKINLFSLPGKGDIEIKEINVAGVRFNYINDKETTNINKLICDITGKTQEEIKAAAEAGMQSVDEPVEKDEEKDERNLVIGRFHTEDIIISFYNGWITAKSHVSLPLPPITLHNIGRSQFKETIVGTFNSIAKFLRLKS